MIKNVEGDDDSTKLSRNIEECLKDTIKAVKIDTGRYQISIPMYKLEGGIYEIFLIEEGDKLYLSDEGKTYSELDEIFELSEPDVIKNLASIFQQYNCEKRDKKFVIECTTENINIKISYLIQAISFALNMKIFYI